MQHCQVQRMPVCLRQPCRRPTDIPHVPFGFDDDDDDGDDGDAVVVDAASVCLCITFRVLLLTPISFECESMYVLSTPSYVLRLHSPRGVWLRQCFKRTQWSVRPVRTVSLRHGQWNVRYHTAVCAVRVQRIQCRHHHKPQCCPCN
jgi:hypothetical protein